MSQEEHPQVHFPPTVRDLVRGGGVIGSAGLILAGVGFKFWVLGDAPDHGAAYTFWTIGSALALIGFTTVATAWKRGAKPGSRQ